MHPATIGSFQIQRELGRGGMGEVYLAVDTRLDRQVAIKALPAHLASDPDRLSRFQREAKVLASLNHPGIGAIYGLEESGGHQYLILEFVEGETLADHLKSGAVPVADALNIARQIAEALEIAHDKGVVHRDLKPGNVMLTPEGVVKVLDFGLARTEEASSSIIANPGAGNSPTLTSPMPAHSPTIPGVILGTAGYMSPEQARGKPVDKRSDIFSFGCVLYELLTQVQPFVGETVPDSIGAIIHREPEWTRLPATTPQRIRELLANCLAKDRRNRLHDIGDARLELERAIAGREWTTTGSPTTGGRGATKLLRPLVWTLAAVTLVLAVAVALLLSARGAGGRDSASQLPRVVRFELEPPTGFLFPNLGEGQPSLCISPAGDKIVVGAEAGGIQRLFMRDLGGIEMKPLPETEGATLPFFSPDGRWLGFYLGGRFMKMPSAGGPAVAICEASHSIATWLSDGTILFANATGLWRVSDGGGTPTLLAAAGPSVRTADGTALILGFNRVDAVPGQPYVLASAWDGDTLESYSVVAASLKDGTLRPVIKNAIDARFVAPDRLLFGRGSSLMAAPFDPVRGEVTGDAVQVVDSLRTTRWGDGGYWAVSSGANGALAYVPGGRSGLGRRLVRVDAFGKSTPLMNEVDALVGALRTSPNGKEVSLTTLRKRVELWTYNLERRSLSLVNAEGESWEPVWTPDGESLIFTRILPGHAPELVRKSAHAGGGSPVERIEIAPDDGGEFYPLDVTPDGAQLLLTYRPPGFAQKSRVAARQMSGDASGKLTPVAGISAGESGARISPDGKLVVCLSKESGRNEAYVRQFGVQGLRVQLSATGTANVAWSRDGKRVYFIDMRGMMYAVDIDAANGLHASAPKQMFDTTGVASNSVWGVGFDCLDDGSFIMVEPAAWENQPARMQVNVNWASP